MISSTSFWVTVVFASIGTYAVRTVPLLFAGRVASLPSGARQALRMIAPSALAALVALAVMRPDGELELFGPRPVAAIVAAAVGWRTRSPLLTMIVGMVSVIGLQAL